MSYPIAFRGPRANVGAGGEAQSAAMRRGFASACERCPEERVESWLVLAGQPVHLEIVGRKLARALCEAFRHLAISNGGAQTPALTISVWDRSATGVEVPRAKGLERLEDVDERGLILGEPQDRVVGCLREGVEIWLDRDAGCAWGSVGDEAALGLQSRGKPFHVPLLVWHADRNAPVLHGALVSHEDAGLFLVGQGGAGKTTAAMACFLDGFNFLGDDYIAVDRLGEAYVGHSLYDSVWLTRDGEARLPSLPPGAQAAGPPEQPKLLVHAMMIGPEHVGREVQICAVACAALSREPEPVLARTTGARALLAMAPSSALQLPVSGSLLLGRMAALAEALPCYELRIGTNLDRLPGLLRALLEREGGT